MSSSKRADNKKNRVLILLFLAAVLIFLVDVYFLALYFSQDRASFFNSSSSDQEDQQNSETTILNHLPLAPPNIKISSTLPATTTTETGAGIGTINTVTLYLGSFGYSIANIDGTKTNLYFDDTVKGIMFPLNYDWRDADSSLGAQEKNNFNPVGYSDFSGPYNDVSCLGTNCLTQKNLALYYNGRALSLPADIKRADIAAISIGALSRRWLVGFTLKNGQAYSGSVYYFDGRNFSRLITPEPISSPYFGLFGFGGEEADFILLYGGAEGIAYQVKGNNLTKLNKFFNLRTMDGGFRAGIIRAAYQDNVNWYIYSKTTGRPRLIKLWQNRGSEIAGVTAFPNLFSSSEPQVAFKIESTAANKIRLLARIVDANGTVSWKEFSDYGFKNDFSGVLTTLSQSHDGNNSEIIIRKVANSQVDIDSSSRTLVKSFFSLDGKKWQDLPLGQGFDFVAPKTKTYYLKLMIPSQTDKFYSPFIDNISFDYQCEKF